jgi:hypothetical protein
MEKRFLFVLVVGFFVSIFGCGGGGGDDGGGGGGTTPTEPAYRIEHQGDVFQVPSGVDDQAMRVIIKNKTLQVVPGMVVRVVYSEFWAGELDTDVRTQDLTTDGQGLCLFKIPRYDNQGDRVATISLPGAPEIKAVVTTVRYVIDIYLPTRVMIADANQAQIALGLNEGVNIVFVVLNAWGDPISNVETQIVVGGEYTNGSYCVTDGNGRATFYFVAGATSGSTVFRIQVIDYPAVMAEVIVSWTASSPASIEMLNPSKWEGSVPVVQTYVGNATDVLFVVKDGGGSPLGGVMVMVIYPAAASDVTDADGIATITIPASQLQGFDVDKVWAVGNDSVFLDFKIEYLNP